MMLGYSEWNHLRKALKVSVDMNERHRPVYSLLEYT